MNSLLRPLAIVCLLPIVATGCVSALGIVKPAARNVQAIEIEGHWKLKGKSTRVTDPEEIRKILTLIYAVKGFKTKRVSFLLDQVESISFHIERSGETTEVSMMAGMLCIPGDSIAFYDTQLDTQEELWDLALQHLGVADEEPVAENLASDKADR